MTIWTGIEVEGPKRGQNTIFVDSEIVDLDIFRKCFEETKISRVYFGAKESFKLPANVKDVIKLALKYRFFPSFEFVFETNSINEVLEISNDIIKYLHVVFVFHTKRINAIKLIEPGQNRLDWFELDNPITNDLNDDLYLTDEIQAKTDELQTKTDKIQTKTDKHRT